MRQLLLTTLLFFCCVTASIAPVSAADKLSVRLDFSPWGVQAAIHLAQFKGWFKDAGLDVEMDWFDYSPSIDAFAAGKIDADMIVAGDDKFVSYRGFGKTNSPNAFGHGGAGGQIGWADPATGISLGYCTNGFDRNEIRQGRRGVALSSLAAVCAL